MLFTCCCFFHAFIGCDTVSSLESKLGKSVKNFPDVFKAFEHFFLMEDSDYLMSVVE